MVGKKTKSDKKKQSMSKPTYANDSDMEKIGGTISILNFNWDDGGCLKEGITSLISRDSLDFVAKDKSYA